MSTLEELHAGTGIGLSFGTLEPILDVVAIHGLNPIGSKNHAIETWQDKKSGNLWLRDRIPLEQPQARVFLYSYNSSPVLRTSKERFSVEADQFLQCLYLERRKDPQRPLLLLGHSLGGLLIKQALVNAFNNPKFDSIQKATYGLIFFGTPHGGSGDDWKIMLGKASVRIAQSLSGRNSNDIMDALKEGSLFTDSLQDLWRHQLGQYKIVTFYEGIGNVVPRSSATLGLPGYHENQIKIEAKHGDMCRFDPSVDMDKINYNFVEGSMLELCENVPHLGISVGQKDYESAIEALRPHCQNPRQYTISEAHQESFQWVWDTQNSKLKFVDWLRSETPIFWISGKPGAGKSTLMKYLLESERLVTHLSRPDATIVVGHFFHELGEPQEKNFGGLLHAIIYQLLTGFQEKFQAALSQLYKLLKPHLDCNLASKAALPDSLLMRILGNLVAKCKETLMLCLFIDGIDECHGDHRMQLDFMTQWARSSSDKKLSVKICFASRVEPEITLRLSNEPTIAIHHFSKNDISKYVTERLGQAWSLMAQQPGGTTAKPDQHLVQKVARKAEGVFIWVTIVVGQLIVAIEGDAGANKLHNLLADLPEGLEKLYPSIIDKIDEKNWHHTINFLRLIRHFDSYYVRSNARTLLGFSAAIEDPESSISCKAHLKTGFTFDDASLPHRRCTEVKRLLQRSCRGLIEIEDSKDLSRAKVTLLHRTVEEHITRSQLLEKMLEKVDRKLLRDTGVTAMAISLRLLKNYPPNYLLYRDDPSKFVYPKLLTGVFNDFFCAAGEAERSTGLSQHLYLEELDRVFSLIQPGWTVVDNEYPIPKDVVSSPIPVLNTDLLSMAVQYHLSLYVQHQIDRNGKTVIKKAHGKALLFYAADFAHTMLYTGLQVDAPALDTCELLLQNGADPMETHPMEARESETPWSWMVMSFLARKCVITPAKPLMLMLEHGADPTQRVFENGHHNVFMDQFSSKPHTTTFHAILSLMDECSLDRPLLKSLVDHCNDFEATDSGGVGIQEWADSLSPEIGASLREEIAAKKQRERSRIASSGQ